MQFFSLKKKEVKVPQKLDIPYIVINGKVGTFLLLFAIFFLFGILTNYGAITYDGLWHDDGLWFQYGSVGKYYQEFREQLGWLIVFNDAAYSYSMVNWGLPATRLCYLALMAFISSTFFILYTKLLRLNRLVAVLASIVPLTLPSLLIPIGLNASYAVLTLSLFSILALFLISDFKTTAPSILLRMSLFTILVFIFLQAGSTSIFLSPLVFLIVFYRNFDIKWVLVVKLLILTGFVIYFGSVYFLNSHKEPVSVSLLEIGERVVTLAKMADFTAFSIFDFPWLSLFLSFLGGIQILFFSSSLFVPRIAKRQTWPRLFLVGWISTWCFSNAFVYVAMTKFYRPFDYAYVFNYGAILLQCIGLFCIFFWLKKQYKRIGNLMVSVLAIVIVLNAIYMKKINLDNTYQYYQGERVSGEIRNTLNAYGVNDYDQFIIADAYTQHPGNYLVNPGYLKYLTNNNTVSGIIGKDMFPHSPFYPSTGWFDVMKSVSKNRKVTGFRMIDHKLVNTPYLLSTVTNSEADFPRFSWSLFDISKSTNKPRLMAEGLDLEDLEEYRRVQLHDIDKRLILFYPDQQEEIISLKEADSRYGEQANFTNHGEYLASARVSIEKLSSPQHVLLVKIRKSLPSKFQLGFSYSDEKHVKKIQSIGFSKEDDVVVIKLRDVKDSSSSISFYRIDQWPYARL